jgi:hypothetical protein
VRKIEQATGQKMQKADLPEDLVIEKTANRKKAEKVKKVVKPTLTNMYRAKLSTRKNPKTQKLTTYSSGTKAKMNMKKKH